MKKLLLATIGIVALAIGSTTNAKAIDTTPGTFYTDQNANGETVIGYTYSQLVQAWGQPIQKLWSNTGANVFAFRIPGGETKYDQTIFVVFVKDPVIYPSETVATVQYGDYLRRTAMPSVEKLQTVEVRRALPVN